MPAQIQDATQMVDRFNEKENMSLSAEPLCGAVLGAEAESGTADG